MRRTFVRATLIALAGLMLVVGAGNAVGAAEPVASNYYLDGFQTERPGTGSARADTDVDRDLNLSASADATGGTKPLIPILNLFPQSTPSEASARALASGPAEGVTGEGDYLVTVTLEGVTSETSETGNGRARTEAFAQVTYQTGLEQFALAGQDNFEPADGTVVVEFEIQVPEGAAPGIQIELRAFAQATGAGNAASAAISGQLTDVTISPIS